MDRQEYLEQLKQRNGYCKCPALKELFDKRREANRLEKSCAFFKSNADLDNPQREDLEFLKEFSLEIENMKKSIKEYYKYLYRHASEGKVYYALHDPIGEKSEIITAIKALNLIKENKSIITMHCPGCKQQIDISEA